MLLRRVCVFCGSSPGVHPYYARAARDAGILLAEQGIGLVYGGGRTGLMGEIADAVLRAGGEVIGVIPEHLRAREIAHERLTELRVVQTMHERKAIMADLADAFIALPGGLGTLEEFFEIATWTQLGIHAKPAGLLDVGGYYHLVNAFLEHAVNEGFLRAEHKALVTISADFAALLDRLRSFQPPPEKWLERSDR